MRLLPAALAAAVLLGCGTVPLTPPGAEAPLVRSIDARVGTSFASAARLAYVTSPVMRIDVGQASVAQFKQAFVALFAETVALPDWPPWRHDAPAVDGVIELERIDAELRIGDDGNRADVVSIAIRICLYEPSGTEIRCWTPSSRNSHQRGLGECLDLSKCILPQMEVVMREVAALFLVAAESDPAVRTWAARIGERREKR
jgi:hypothetical protein